MRALTVEEREEVIDLAYETAENYIFSRVNKKDFDDVDITINLVSLDDGFDIDIEVNLHSDFDLPDDLSERAIEESLSAVDEYIEKRDA